MLLMTLKGYRMWKYILDDLDCGEQIAQHPPHWSIRYGISRFYVLIMMKYFQSL